MSRVLHRQLDNDIPLVDHGEGHYLVLQDGRRILDGSGGAAVSCIGHNNQRVIDAVVHQMTQVSYCSTSFFSTGASENLCQFLVESTGGKMSKALIVNSGSEAVEAAAKLARQFFLEKNMPEPQRIRFISRDQSYHGATLGALSIGGHKLRRQKFQSMLNGNCSKVSPCYPYRYQDFSESEEDYVARLLQEIENEFVRLGQDTVCAFFMEPVVGAALGCVPALNSYIRGVRRICDKYGALLVFDEVMCGMGRTGTLHAWQYYDVVPDLQTIGKGLGGGYQPIAGLLIGPTVVNALSRGTKQFVHGQTYQCHPVACAAALEVQTIIQKENLLNNVQEMGRLLSGLLLGKLAKHPNIGNIRGRGLFWGVEFVKNKKTKQPFPASDKVAARFSQLSMSPGYELCVYPGSGTVNGEEGDHVIIAPAYTMQADDIKSLVDIFVKVVDDFFK